MRMDTLTCKHVGAFGLVCVPVLYTRCAWFTLTLEFPLFPDSRLSPLEVPDGFGGRFVMQA